MNNSIVILFQIKDKFSEYTTCKKRQEYLNTSFFLGGATHVCYGNMTGT